MNMIGLPTHAAVEAAGLQAALATIVGPAHVLTGSDAAPRLIDHRGCYRGNGVAVVRPGSTAEVAEVVALCARHRVPIVPQGGNTGLCGGATPDASGRAVVLVLSRLNRVRAGGRRERQHHRRSRLRAGRRAGGGARTPGACFRSASASEGSCTIGGNLSTNAGGTQVLRYGNARELVLGLEVVLPDGRDLGRPARPAQGQYRLRPEQLFIGSEGTLGIITAAMLRLFPLPAAEETAFIAFPSAAAAVAFLAAARAGFGAALTGFELISGPVLDLVARHQPDSSCPTAPRERRAPWHALIEISGSDTDAHTTNPVGGGAGGGDRAGEVVTPSLPRMRARPRHCGRCAIAPSARRCDAKAAASATTFPCRSRASPLSWGTPNGVATPVPWRPFCHLGHLGDGNLHYNVIPPGMCPFGSWKNIQRLVHDRGDPAAARSLRNTASAS